MAVPSFIQVAPAGNGGSNVLYTGTIGANGNSGVITTGNDMIIRVVGSLPLTIRFGTSTNLTAATAADIYIPANAPETFDMGHYNNAISIFAFQAATVVSVNLVSKN